MSDFNKYDRWRGILGMTAGSNLKETAQDLSEKGRHGDTEVVHVNPQEVEMLKKMGGSGTINPETGLREFNFFGFDSFTDAIDGGGKGGSGSEYFSGTHEEYKQSDAGKNDSRALSSENDKEELNALTTFTRVTGYDDLTDTWDGGGMGASGDAWGSGNFLHLDTGDADGKGAGDNNISQEEIKKGGLKGLEGGIDGDEDTLMSTIMNTSLLLANPLAFGAVQMESYVSDIKLSDAKNSITGDNEKQVTLKADYLAASNSFTYTHKGKTITYDISEMQSDMLDVDTKLSENEYYAYREDEDGSRIVKLSSKLTLPERISDTSNMSEQDKLDYLALSNKEFDDKTESVVVVLTDNTSDSNNLMAESNGDEGSTNGDAVVAQEDASAFLDGTYGAYDPKKYENGLSTSTNGAKFINYNYADGFGTPTDSYKGEAKPLVMSFGSRYTPATWAKSETASNEITSFITSLPADLQDSLVGNINVIDNGEDGYVLYVGDEATGYTEATYELSDDGYANLMSDVEKMFLFANTENDTNFNGGFIGRTNSYNSFVNQLTEDLEYDKTLLVAQLGLLDPTSIGYEQAAQKLNSEIDYMDRELARRSGDDLSNQAAYSLAAMEHKAYLTALQKMQAA